MRTDRAPCTLSECRFSSQNGVVGPRFGRQLDLVVGIGRVSCRECVWQRRRWGHSLGTPVARTLLLKAPSSTEGDGDALVDPHRPHRSLSLELIGVSLASLGRACGCVLCPALSGRRVIAGAHRAAAARVRARIAPAAATNRTTFGRQAASHPLLRCFDTDLAHGGWQRDRVCRKGVGGAGEPVRSASRRSGCQS
jgi:hypothetical protein